MNMKDSTIAIVTRGKLVAMKTAAGMSARDAGKWADDHLNDAIALVKTSPQGSDPFVRLGALR
jgi:hypothetical protein